MDLQIPHNRQHPFMASIKERYSLSKLGSKKEIVHVILDIEGSGLKYNVGDSIGVFAVNDAALVERTLKALKASGDEIVQNRHGESFTFRNYLASQANLKGITRKTVQKLITHLSEEYRAPLELLLEDGNKEALKEWMASHELWDLIEHHPEVRFTPEEVVDIAMPLLPRFYSIASSQSVRPNEVHLTIAYLRYETRGISRVGVCTHYLCQLAELHHPVVPVYIQPSNDFKLPNDPNTPIIMIGPGTGVAPYRAFMQEREARGDAGKNWLFFGEWTSSHEYFYEEEWKHWESLGKLKIDTAFSRDQEHKVYVQHRLKEKGAEIYQWLENNAILYVCGDAHQMAKDVEKVLGEIIQEHGGKDALGAREYIKRLRSEKRYLRDVY